jgi:hypothetical protein
VEAEVETDFMFHEEERKITGFERTQAGQCVILVL